MALKHIVLGVFCVTLLFCGGPSRADEYSPDQFLKLDLPKAIFSPKRLGPDTQFAPVGPEVKAGKTAERKTVAPKVAEHKVVDRKPVHAQARLERPHGAARVKLARRHGNPLDAQALDTRIQVWPCRSGGICDWQR